MNSFFSNIFFLVSRIRDIAGHKIQKQPLVGTFIKIQKEYNLQNYRMNLSHHGLIRQFSNCGRWFDHIFLNRVQRHSNTSWWKIQKKVGKKDVFKISHSVPPEVPAAIFPSRPRPTTVHLWKIIQERYNIGSLPHHRKIVVFRKSLLLISTTLLGNSRPHSTQTIGPISSIRVSIGCVIAI